MKKFGDYFVVAMLALLLANTFSQADQIDDVAPPLNFTHWLRGAPVYSFERGHIYVVEFWSTTCGPCLDSIPELNRLQKLYADKVTIIGVASTYELGANADEKLKTLNSFMDFEGKNIDYRIAFDGDGESRRQYMDAYHQWGIPAAFIVNERGKISYIGHSLSLDAALKKITSRTWDGSTEKKDYVDKWSKSTDEDSRFKIANKEVTQLLVQEKFEEALAVMKKNEDVAVWYHHKFRVLMILGRRKEAFHYTEETVQKYWDNPYTLYNILELLESMPEKYKVKYVPIEYQLAVRLRETLTPKLLNGHPEHFMPVLARGFYDSGHPIIARKLLKSVFSEYHVKFCLDQMAGLE